MCIEYYHHNLASSDCLNFTVINRCALLNSKDTFSFCFSDSVFVSSHVMVYVAQQFIKLFLVLCVQIMANLCFVLHLFQSLVFTYILSITQKTTVITDGCPVHVHFTQPSLNDFIQLLPLFMAFKYVHHIFCMFPNIS